MDLLQRTMRRPVPRGSSRRASPTTNYEHNQLGEPLQSALVALQTQTAAIRGGGWKNGGRAAAENMGGFLISQGCLLSINPQGMGRHAWAERHSRSPLILLMSLYPGRQMPLQEQLQAVPLQSRAERRRAGASAARERA